MKGNKSSMSEIKEEPLVQILQILKRITGSINKFVYKLDNLHEIRKFLKSHKLPKNNPIYIKETICN